jgi:hypothetical protein
MDLLDRFTRTLAGQNVEGRLVILLFHLLFL